MKKRILSILMIFVCLVSSFSSPFVVYAADDVVTQYDTFRQLFDEEGQIHIDDFIYFISKGDNDALNGALYGLTKIGFALPNLTVNASLKLADIFSFGYSSDFIAMQRVNDNIKYSQEFLDYLKSACNNYLYTNSNCISVPYLSGFPSDLDEAVSLFLSYTDASYSGTSGFSTSGYESYLDFISDSSRAYFLLFPTDGTMQIFRSPSGYLYPYSYGSDFYIANGCSASASYQRYFDRVVIAVDSYRCLRFYINKNIMYGSPVSNGRFKYPFFSNRPNTKFFFSLSDLSKYYYLDKPAYYSSSFSSETDYSGSVPEGNIFNYDWSSINQSIYDAVKDSDNGLSEDDLQNVIDGYFASVQDALSDVNEGIIDNGEKLDVLITQISTSGERQSSWLAKIYNYLCEILPVIADGSGSSGSGVSDQAVTDRLDSIISLLEDNLDILEDIEGNTADIRTLLALDDAENSFFDLMAYKLQTSESVMKERFPTSIPWDVMMVVAAFAEESEAPVFDIPIKVQSLGVQETIHIDLSETSTVSDFSKLSKISRTILSITFLLFLIILTKNLFGGDD